MTTNASPAVAATFEPGELRSFYGGMPSGVLALAAVVDGAPVGMTVSSFTNVSLNPPLMVVSIRKGSATWRLLSKATTIGASILAEPQAEFSRKLATGGVYNRFDGIDYTVTDRGAIIIDEAAGWFEASKGKSIKAGDHRLVLLNLQNFSTPVWRRPLVFFRSKFAGVHHHG